MEQEPDHHADENLPAHDPPGSPSPPDRTDNFDLLSPGRGEMRTGSRPGDLRYVIVRPEEPELRRVQTGLLEATEAAEKPEGSMAQAAY
ncbi:MAG: hypothetical protein J2P36_07805, partial [Ktedonobacteraceae bacterium]|nr:hypothetical protein [Ktedonobacteraceae bacterium]